MSYASVAASGPQQRAPAVPEVEHTEEDVHELIDVDSPHISSVPADFKSQEIQTETQAERERLESEAREKAQQAKQSAQQAEKQAEEVKQKAEKKSEEVKDKAEQKTEEVKEKAGEVKEKAGKKAEEVKEKAEEVAEKTKQKAQKATEKAKANSDNPVVIGNTVAVVALGGLLGFGAYRKYNAGQLTWKVAGAWAGVVGAFALGDYYASQ
ncbi:hypothetical protein E4T45_12798 [Aureobasidium sp. EXF-8846]|nr:hypothetical protein E4T45_12798 [Aureobasidium sp. EXF-8846]